MVTHIAKTTPVGEGEEREDVESLVIECLVRGRRRQKLPSGPMCCVAVYNVVRDSAYKPCLLRSPPNCVVQVIHGEEDLSLEALKNRLEKRTEAVLKKIKMYKTYTLVLYNFVLAFQRTIARAETQSIR